MSMQLNVTVNPVFNSSQFASAGSKAGADFAAGLNSSIGKSQPLGRITGQVSEFQKSMEAANARVLAFGASAGSIYIIKTAFEKLISSTIQVEKSIAEINNVLGLSSSLLKSFSSEIFRAASLTGQTFETASKVALEFSRQGNSAAETVKRMEAALQLMRVSGLGAEQSVGSITAALNAFVKEGLTAEEVVNRLAAVDTKFAVSSEDLANAIQRVGSVAADAGIEFNQLLGLVTAAQTITARGGAVIGNAFKSIFTRLARPQVLDDLKSVGVETTDATGKILPMITVLKNLARQYDSLDSSQKSFIAEAVGGVYQINILKAALADLGNGISIFDRAAITAGQSSGMMQQRMEELNQTISAKLNTSANELTKLFANFGEISLGSNIKGMLDDFNKNISFLSSMFEDIVPDDSVVEKIVKTFSRGIAKGLGGIISGPGLQILTTLLVKVFSDIGKFAISSSREFMGMNDELNKQKDIVQSIQSFLGQNPKILEAIKSGQLNINEAHLIYLKQLQQENKLKEENLAIATSMASNAAPYITTSKDKNAATGFIPNFSETDSQRERRMAISHGYSPGPVFKTLIHDGNGGASLSTVNGAEKIKTVTNEKGYKATFVIPPNGFGKNTQFAAAGFAPNFEPQKIGEIRGGGISIGTLKRDYPKIKAIYESQEESEGIDDTDIISVSNIDIYKIPFNKKTISAFQEIEEFRKNIKISAEKINEKRKTLEKEVLKFEKQKNKQNEKTFELTENVSFEKGSSAVDIVGEQTAIEVKSGRYNEKEVREKFYRYPVENNPILFPYKGNFNEDQNDTIYSPDNLKLYVSPSKKEIEEKLKELKENKASGFVPNFGSKVGVVTGDALRGNQYKKALEYLANTNKPVTSIVGPAGSGKTSRAVNEYGGEIIKSTNFDDYESFIFDRAGFELPEKDKTSAENIQKILRKSGSIDVLISSRDTLAKAREKRAGEGDKNIPERSYFKTGSGGAGTFVKGVRQFLSENENAKVFQLKQGEKGFYHSQLNLASGFIPNFAEQTGPENPQAKISDAAIIAGSFQQVWDKRISDALVKEAERKIKAGIKKGTPTTEEANLRTRYEETAGTALTNYLETSPELTYTKILQRFHTNTLPGGGSFPGFDYILDTFTNNNFLKNKLNWKDNYSMEVGGKQMTGAKGKMLLSMKTSDANEKAAEIRRKMELGKERLRTAGALGAEEQTSEILVGLYGSTLSNQTQAFKKSKKQLGKEDYNIIGPRTSYGSRGRIEVAAASGFVPNFASENAIKTMQEMVERAKNSKDPSIINEAKIAKKRLEDLGYASKQIKAGDLQASFGSSGIDITLTDIDEQFEIEEAAIREYGKNAFVHIQKNSIEKLKNLIKNNPNLAKNFSALKKEMGDNIRVAETPYAAGFVPNFFNYLNEARNILKESGLNLDNINNQNFSQFKEVIKSKVGGTNIREYEKALENYLYGGSTGWSLKKPSSKGRGGYREFGSGFIPNFALPDFGANQNITLSKSQIEDALKKAKTTGNYEGLEHLIYQSLTSKIGTGRDLTSLQQNISKEEREAYAASLSGADKNSGAWAQWDVKKTGNKPSDKRIDNYKSYFSMDFNSLMALNKNGAELKQKLTPLTEKYGMDLSFKVPGGALSGLTHNDSLVVHYTNNQAAQEVEQTVNDFIKSKKMSLGTRAYNRGIDLINKNVGLPTKDSLKRQTPVSSYGGYLAKQITHDLASGTSLQESISKRIKNAFASGFVPNFNSKALAEAKNREMAAGYSSSEVKVGYDSRLKKSGGVGVYNKDEGSLANAINMHLASGKDLNEIQTQGAASGFVPNFGATESILLGVATALGKEFKEVSEKLYFGYNKQMEASKKVVDATLEVLNSFLKLQDEFNKGISEKTGAEKEEFIEKKQAEMEETLMSIDPDSVKAIKDAFKAKEEVRESRGQRFQSLQEEYSQAGTTEQRKIEIDKEAFQIIQEMSEEIESSLDEGGKKIYEQIVKAKQELSDIDLKQSEEKEAIEKAEKELSALGTNINPVINPEGKKRSEELEKEIKARRENLESLKKEKEKNTQEFKTGREQFEKKTGLAVTEDFDLNEILKQKNKLDIAREYEGAAKSKGKEVEQFGEQYVGYRKQFAETYGKTQSYAGRVAVASPVVGGIASSLAESMGYKDAGKAIGTLTEGVTMASQAMMALPGHVGMAIGGLVLLNSAFNAIKDFQLGIEEATKDFEDHRSKMQKSIAASSALIESYDKISTLYNSGNVSLSQFLAATNQVTQSMIQLSAISPELAEKMRQARTPEERAAVQSEFASRESAKSQSLEYKKGLKEFRSERTKFWSDPESKEAGIFTSQYEGDTEAKRKLDQGTQVVLNEIMQSISETGTDQEKEMVREIAQTISKGERISEKQAAFLYERREKSGTYTGELKENEQAFLSKNLNTVLANMSVSDSDRAAYEAQIQALNDARTKENAIRKLYNQELQNSLNAGTRLSNAINKKALSDLSTRQTGLEVQTYGKERELDLRSAVTSEYEIAQKRGQLRYEAKEEEGILEQSRIKAETGMGMMSDFDAAIKNELKNSFKTDDIAGVVKPTDEAVATADFWSKRQQAFSGEEGAQKLRDIVLNRSPEEAAREILGEKDENIPQNVYDRMAAELTTKIKEPGTENRVLEELQKGRESAERNAAELKKIGADNVAATKGIQIKEMAQALGGIATLKRGGARQYQRQIRRAERLVTYGRTDQARGEGAVTLMQNTPEHLRTMQNPAYANLTRMAVKAETANINRLMKDNPMFKSLFGDEAKKPGFAEKWATGKIFTNIKAGGLGEDFYQKLGLSLEDNLKDATLPWTKSLEEASTALDNFIRKIQEMTDPKGRETKQSTLKAATQAAQQEVERKKGEVGKDLQSVQKQEGPQLPIKSTPEAVIDSKAAYLFQFGLKALGVDLSPIVPLIRESQRNTPSSSQGNGRASESSPKGGTSSLNPSNTQNSSRENLPSSTPYKNQEQMQMAYAYSSNQTKESPKVVANVVISKEAFLPIQTALQDVVAAINAGQNRPVEIG